jgi:hypothetical protein
MAFGKNTVTTIHGRSFGGLLVAHLAVTLVVCGGLVLLLPTPASASSVPAITSVVSVLDCVASTDPAGTHEFTGKDASLDAPDSSDDDDDDDATTGADAAITVDQCRTPTRGDVLHVVHVKVGTWISRTVEGHSLRGPPTDDQTSSDADDVDGDDDDPIAECPDLLPPATGRETCVLSPVQFVSASSTRSSDLSLRAPPL